MMQPGQFDQIVSLFKPSTTVDRFGQRTEWVLVADVAAYVRPTRGRDFFAAGSTQNPAQLVMDIYYRPDVQANWRLVWLGNTYDLVSPPVDLQGKHQFLELYCTASAGVIPPPPPPSPFATTDGVSPGDIAQIGGTFNVAAPDAVIPLDSVINVGPLSGFTTDAIAPGDGVTLQSIMETGASDGVTPQSAGSLGTAAVFTGATDIAFAGDSGKMLGAFGHGASDAVTAGGTAGSALTSSASALDPTSAGDSATSGIGTTTVGSTDAATLRDEASAPILVAKFYRAQRSGTTPIYAAVAQIGTPQTYARFATDPIVFGDSAISSLVGAPPPPPPPPPPPASPGVLSTNVTLQSTTTANAPFAIGHAFKQGDVSASQDVAVTGAIAQVTKLNAWPDGSLKFAVIAGTALLTANTPAIINIARGTASTGTAITTADLQTAMTGQTCTIGCGAFGSAAFGSSDFAAPFVTHIVGHRMSSWVYRKQVGSDPHLVAWLEVRCFAGGIVEILPWVENGYLMVPGPVTKTATYTFTLGPNPGTLRFSLPIDLLARLRAPLVSGGKVSHWLGTAYDVSAHHEGDYFQSTKTVPSYLVNIDPQHAQIATLPTQWQPYDIGLWDPGSLAQGGFHNHVCALPHWDALYLTSTALATWKGVIFQHYGACRYDWNYRDEVTNRAMLFADHDADLVINWSGAAAGYNTPPLPANEGPQNQQWSIDHAASIGYLAYLITGRWFFVDMMQQVAAWNYLTVPGSLRNGSGRALPGTINGRLGIIDSRALATRGCAWAWRQIVHTVSATPDSGLTGRPDNSNEIAQKAQYLQQLKNNIDWFKTTWTDRNISPLGWLTNLGGDYNHYQGTATSNGTTTTIFDQNQVDPGIGDGQYVGFFITIGAESRQVIAYDNSIGKFTVGVAFTNPVLAGTAFGFDDHVNWDAPWMQDYNLTALGMVKDLDVGLDATSQAKLDAYFNWKAQTTVARLGGTGSTEWLYRDVGPYGIAIGPADFLDWDNGTGPWFTDWGTVYAKTFSGTTQDYQGHNVEPFRSPGPKVDGPIRTLWQPYGFDKQSQELNFQRGLAYVVRYNAPGALAGYTRYSNAANYWQLRRDMEAQGFAQGALSPYVMPKWRHAQSVNQWREISGTNMFSLVPTNTARTTAGGNAIYGPAARTDTWCGLSIDTRSSTIWSVANGGHGDYYGNEVLAIDLMADVPTWVEKLAGSSGNVVRLLGVDVPDVFPPDRRLAQYTDGKPASRHSYYGQQFIERQNRAISGGGSTAMTGKFFENVESFDTVNLAWDSYDAATQTPLYGYALGGTSNGNAQGWSTCKDPRNDHVFTIYQTLREFTPSGAAGGSWTSRGLTPLNPGSGAVFVVDTQRNRLIWMLGGGGTADVHLYDLSTSQWTTATMPSSAAKTQMMASTALQDGAVSTQSAGGVYVPDLDAVFVRMGAGGPLVYKIDAATWTVSILSTSGGSTIGAGHPFNGEQGVYNKFLFVPALRGVVYVPGNGSNIWFLRLY